MRTRRKLLAAGLLAPLALVLADIGSYSRQAWLSDYAQLKSDLARGYANLDWAVQVRKLDLVALDAQTKGALQSSISRVQAWWALRRFVRTFGDPHLKMTWHWQPALPVLESNWHRPRGGAPDHSSERADAPAPPVRSCAEAGYEKDNHGFRLPLRQVPGWRQLAEDPFPAGVAGKTGVLRIAAFGEDRYRPQCEQVFAGGETARALQLRVRAALQALLEQRLQTLRDAGIRRLVLDLTGNGGGTEWVEDAIPLFTARSLQRNAPLGPTLRCDRSPIWRGAPVCPLLDNRGEQVHLQGRGLWSGPLQIWMDSGTGSASEDFVAWFRDNQAATLEGHKTAGAGCGYVDGGHLSALPTSGLRIRMPNCARYLRDGRNEMEGIGPDVAHAFDPAGLRRLLLP